MAALERVSVADYAAQRASTLSGGQQQRGAVARTLVQGARIILADEEAIDPRPVEGVRSVGATRLQEVVWGVAPQVAPLWTSYALYRFESNARAATCWG